MAEPALTEFLDGLGTFVRRDRGALDRLFGDGLQALPRPQRIFLEKENSEPLEGFPLLMSEGSLALQEALRTYCEAEERAQVAAVRRDRIDRDHYSEAWQEYHRLLRRAVENATLSSYGRRYPSIFWLAHSLDVARLLKDTPRRILRLDLEIGRKEGNAIKYRVFDRFLDRARAATQETLRNLATESREIDDDLFPTLLRQLAENVLIFTEEHIGPDLRELSAYLGGHLELNGTDFRQRFERLRGWHEERLASQEDLATIQHEVLGISPDQPQQALFRPGFVRFLASREDYSSDDLLSADQIDLWDDLLPRLQRFEVLNELRKKVLPLRAEGQRLVFRAGSRERARDGRRLIHVSSSTRPLDFASPWVIDPVVHRHGLIYDITEYSRIISLLRKTGRDAQEHGFRMMFRFQRQVDALARKYRLNLEKFLGDGAFYTSRHPVQLVTCALHLQRTYRSFLRQGLPFDRGLRMGLNSSLYRLMPIHTADDGDVRRYEFFGHGVVELSRLTSGKVEQELEDIQNELISRGYPPESVSRFFEPVLGKTADADDTHHPLVHTFQATLGRDGTLRNEGVVATADLISELDRELGSRLLYSTRSRGQSFVVVPIDDEQGVMMVLLRKLGRAKLKGLDDLTVYEIADGGKLGASDLKPLRRRRLAEALEEVVADELGNETVDSFTTGF